jgi:hypothetical protein
VESLELCANFDGGRECVARRFGQGVRTRNRDGVFDGSALHVLPSATASLVDVLFSSPIMQLIWSSETYERLLFRMRQMHQLSSG